MVSVSDLPTKILGGVAVPYTPLVQKALDFARKISTDDIYNHAVRTFLLGFLVADKIPHLKNRDREVHAVASILHDTGLPMGQQLTDTTVSTENRFEVDSANAARQFLADEGQAGAWDKGRLQLVWDSIALHAIGSIASHKEPEVQACALGIRADFLGPEAIPNAALTWGEYDACVKAYPRLGISRGFKNNMLTLCRTKPRTTFDNTAGEWGKRYLSLEEYVPISGQMVLEASLVDLDTRENRVDKQREEWRDNIHYSK